MTRLTESVPPVPVSRLLLLLFVAAGAVISIASEGRLSNFAGGFAVGAGAVLVVSFLKSSGRQPADGGRDDSRDSGETP